MQSIIRKKFYGSVKVFSLDSELLISRLKNLSLELAEKRPEVLAAVLFGSAAEGRALPSSDVDILLVVKRSEERFIDRPDTYRQYFRSIPMDVDCKVYTVGEIKSGNHPLAETALKGGLVLFDKAGAILPFM
jgi:predicted nucleotidyltransferase